jgi:DNA-binding PadR family transcriptional regulator
MAADPQDHLPLKQGHYLILLALTPGDLHGYGIKKAVAAQTEGRVRLGAGSLYRSIGLLQDEGLIEASNWRPDPRVDDERREYLRLTDLGRRVATAETDRLAALVSSARAAGLEGAAP